MRQRTRTRISITHLPTSQPTLLRSTFTLYSYHPWFRKRAPANSFAHRYPECIHRLSPFEL